MIGSNALGQIRVEVLVGCLVVNPKRMEMQEHPKRKSIPSSAPHTQRQKSLPISMYSVQCCKCYKWRLVSTQEEYEEIRKNFTDDPWFCTKKPNVSCEDPGDIEYDTTRMWVMDKPNIPKTPDGFKRTMVLRSDFSRCDLYYHLPTGKKVRSLSEIERFLEANPEYKSMVKITDFNFTSPRIMEGTITANAEVKPSTSKKMKK